MFTTNCPVFFISFINGLHHPVQPSFPPFYSTITLQVKLSTTRIHYHVNKENLHHLVTTSIAKFSLCCHNFSCVQIKSTKVPVFSLSGKVNIQIACFPAAVATLIEIILSVRYVVHYLPNLSRIVQPIEYC